MGMPAFFVRTLFCPIKCPWCDSAGTWNPHWMPKDTPKMTPEEIIKEAVESTAPIVVVTGGEPTIHNLKPLVDEGHKCDLRMHLETSGAFDIRGEFDWITLSPKRWKSPIWKSVRAANEFKIIVEHEGDIPFYLKMLKELGKEDNRLTWLHPEWSHRQDPVILGAISDTVKKGRGTVRAGYQIHKLYQVDYRDTRTREMVPLGGDLTKGY